MQHAHQLIYYYFNKVSQLWARMTFIISFITWFNWLQQQINNEKKTHRRNTLSIHFRAFLQREFEHFFYFNNVRTFNTMSNTKREIKLRFSKNWDVWLSIVRAKISEYLIWKFIDSSKKTRSINKFELIEFDLNIQLNDNFNEKFVKYKITSSKYKKKL